MKERMGKWLLLGLVALTIALCFVGAPLSVSAEYLTGSGASLVMPSSYEQHLALKDPVDMAFSENHIAIADGKTLYLYDYSAKSYSSSVIPDEGDGDDSTITKVGFSGDKLFVSVRAASNSFYEYDFSTHTFKKLTINCTTFYINNGTLYTANVGGAQTNIASYSVSDLTSGNTPATKSLGTIDLHTTPSITMLGEILYCTFDDRVYRIDPSIGTFTKATPFYLSSDPSDTSNVQSTCIHENVFYYTSSNGLYRNEFATDKTPTKATCVLEGTGYGALTSFDGKLYAVKGSSIIEIGFEDFQASLTGYEISASSASVGRLSGAVDTARAGDLLVTADADNKRISVTVFTEDEAEYGIGACSAFSCIDENGCPYTPTHIATDGYIIAVSSDDAQIYLYRFGNDTHVAYHDFIGDTVVDLACMNGSCYFITESVYGKAEEDCVTFRYINDTPKALAVDANDFLCVVSASGKVYSYTETEFISSNAEVGTKKEFTIDGDISSLQIDGNGDLYYIRQNALWKNDTQLAELGKLSFVYGDNSVPIAFAMDFEDDVVFFLHENYIVKASLGSHAVSA